jgi:2-aminoadipate transaminase
VYEFLRRGALEPHVLRLRDELRARRDALTAALARHFAGATWNRPEGGFFVWLELPPGTDGRAVLERAEGVTAVAGTSFGWSANCLRLSFAGAAPDELEAAVERLAAAV